VLTQLLIASGVVSAAAAIVGLLGFSKRDV
jgi:hypothetical protein